MLYTCPYCNKMFADHGLAQSHIDACPKRPPEPEKVPLEKEKEPSKPKAGGRK